MQPTSNNNANSGGNSEGSLFELHIKLYVNKHFKYETSKYFYFLGFSPFNAAGFSLNKDFPWTIVTLIDEYFYYNILEVMSELKSLKSEVGSLKRDLNIMAEKQLELIKLVKAIKRGCESSQFDMGKCCHTVSSQIIHILLSYYKAKIHLTL